MARSFESERLRVLREFENGFTDDMRSVARQLAGIVNRHAQVVPGGVDRVIPQNRRTRENIKNDMWREVLKPYFIGRGEDALTGVRANSPYAQRIVQGVEVIIQNEVRRQLSIVRKYADPVVWNWLTDSSRVISEIGPTRHGYDAFHLFVDRNGYRLSDRIWNTAVDVRSRIDRLMLYHIQQGTAAVKIADLLVPFLTGEEAGRTTRTPYGTVGSYSARRLARTEITAAAGRAVVNANLANPWVAGTKWNLSPSHPKTDNCDNNAAGGENGVYANDAVPQYPDHPHCLCYLTPEVVVQRSEVNRTLREEIDQAQGRLRISDDVAAGVRAGVLQRVEGRGALGAGLRLDTLPSHFDIDRVRGTFNEDWMQRALLNGDFTEQVLGGIQGL